jgi:hypothetical protein
MYKTFFVILYSCAAYVTYLVTLHPVSGFLGGIFVSLFWYIIPTSVFLSIGWLMSHLVMKRFSLIGMFLFSMILTLVISIPSLYKSYYNLRADPEVVVAVRSLISAE